MFRLLLLFCVSTWTILAAPQPQPFRRPLVFEPNHGQAPESVKWIARTSGYQLLLTNEGATIVLPEDWKSDRSAIQMKLTGSNKWSEMTGLEPTGGVSNYLLDNDPDQWHTGIPHYARLTATQIYDGIDLVFYSHQGDLEYDFVVAPGADPKQIRLAFDGVDQMRVEPKSGDLLLTTAGGSELRHLRPKVYQQVGNQRVEVAGGYDILDRRQVTFTLASYDRQRPLVIDPTITTFFPGNGLDIATALAVNSAGDVWATGYTDSTNFLRVGSLQADQPGRDVFVAKMSSNNVLVFSTYLGGNGFDGGMGVAVDSTGAYVTGYTNSSDFPIRNSIYPYRSEDAFVTKLTPAGDALIYSTFLGGSGGDSARGIAVDSAHGAWVIGRTYSEDFPIAGGPSAGQQRKYGGGLSDAFLARVAPDGLSVAFSTYVGGPGADTGYAVAIDRTGSVYATGSGGSGFPITTGMRPCGASFDAFVVRLKGRGTQARYATCLGPGWGYDLTVDSNFNTYVTGATYGGFPTTPGAFQRKKPATSSFDVSGYVSKLNSFGKVVYSTYFGGTDGFTSPNGIGVDSTGAVYIGGQTGATKFPGLPPLAPAPTLGFLSKLTSGASGLTYSQVVASGISGLRLFKPASSPLQIHMVGHTGDENKPDAIIVKIY